MNGRHPGSKGLSLIASFQLGDSRLEGSHGGAAVARIDVSVPGGGKDGIQVIHTVVQVANGGVNGGSDGCEVGVWDALASVDGAGDECFVM